jgi:hypothetical protein
MSDQNERTRLLLRDLGVAYDRLCATANDTDTEGAHAAGDTIMADVVRLLASHMPDDATALTLATLAVKYDELRRDWWYA